MVIEGFSAGVSYYVTWNNDRIIDCAKAEKVQHMMSRGNLEDFSLKAHPITNESVKNKNSFLHPFLRTEKKI